MGRQISKSILASLSLAGLAVQAQNLSFEQPVDSATATVPGWDTGRSGQRIRIDDTIAQEGRNSLLIDARQTDARLRFSTAVDATTLRATRLRIGAYILRDDPSLEAGLWARVRGPKGWLHITSRALEPAAGAGAWIALTLDVPLAPAAIELSFGGETDGSGPVRFDNFTVFPSDPTSLQPPSVAAERYLERVLDILQSDSVRRASVDWTDLRAAAKLQNRGASSETDAHLAAQFAVSLIDDGHSYFMSPGQMNRLDAGLVSNARTGRPTREPAWRSLAGGLGYIEVPGFAGGSQLAQADFASALQTIIANLDATGGCGWIVDLRGNRGGNLWPMLAGIGPLLEPGEAGAALYPDGTRQSFWYRDGRVGLGEYTQLRVRSPLAIVNREAPVAVLTDRATASAAEILTVALRARTNSRSFGEPTRGAHSATRVYPLADEAAIVLAVAATVNARGDRFEGPIAPDVQVAAAALGDRPGGDPGREPIVAAAIDWLQSASACTP